MTLYVFDEAAAESNRAQFVTGPSTLLFSDGRPLQDRILSEEIDLRIKSVPKKLDFFYVGSMPVVSAALQKLLTTAGVDAEFIHIPQTGRISLFAFNLLIAKNCVDRNATIYKKCEFGLSPKILRLVLDAEKVPRVPMFRLRRASTNPFIINTELRDALLDSELTGFEVTPVEQWTDHYDFNALNQSSE